jgi:hypothetical protein
VLPSYRLSREPSGPRTKLWRRLKRLGVAQLSDGLVALPADARTREALEWLADDVLAADGTAGLWVARDTTTCMRSRHSRDGVTQASHTSRRPVPRGAEITPAGSTSQDGADVCRAPHHGLDVQERRSTSYFRRLRAITMRWTWLVPS